MTEPTSDAVSAPAPVVPSGGLLGRAGWNLVDQVISSGSSAVLSLVLARELGVSGFGAYALVFGLYTFAIGLAATGGLSPFQVRFSGADRDAQRVAAAGAAGAVAVSGAASGLACLVAAPFATGEVSRALVAFAVALPFLLLAECWRTLLKAVALPKQAAVVDIVFAVMQAIGLVELIASHHLSAWSAVLNWGIAAAIAHLTGVAFFDSAPSLPDAREWWRSHKDLSGVQVADWVLVQGATQVALALVAGLGGLAATGGLRGAQVLLGPVQVLYLSAWAFALPELARRRDAPPRTQLRAALAISGFLTTAVVGWGTVLLLVPDDVGHKLLGDTWEHAQPCLLPMSLAFAVQYATVGPGTLMLSLERPRISLVLGVAVAVVTLVAMPYGAKVAGGEGAAWGFFLAQGCILPAWWWVCWRLVHGRSIQVRLCSIQTVVDLGIPAFAAVVTLLVGWALHHRVPPHAPLSEQGRLVGQSLQGFRDSVWLPVRDLVSGHVPYDPVPYLHRHPGTQAFDPYAPWSLLLGAPFAALPYRLAGAEWMLVNALAALLSVRLVLARLSPASLRWAPWATALLLLTPPGRNALQGGQWTLLVGLGLTATFFGDRPWVRGLGFALVATKPEFVPVVLVVLVVRREWPALKVAVAAAVVAGIGPLLLLVSAAGSPRSLVDAVRRDAHHASADAVGTALHGVSTRIDVSGALSTTSVHSSQTGLLTVIATLTLAALAGVVAHRTRLSPRSVVRAPAVVVVLSATLLTVVHHQTDRAVLLPVLVGLVALALEDPRERLRSGIVATPVALLVLRPRRVDTWLDDHLAQHLWASRPPGALSVAIDTLLLLALVALATTVALHRARPGESRPIRASSPLREPVA